ncbi:hypothetical protein [Suttonella ornithocola]|nr:hypothetical protein [Suttonella ornithocola]
MDKKLFLLSFLYLPLYIHSEDNWLDKTHNKFSETLDKTAASINSWFGENTQNADAELRILLDNGWNRYDGYSIHPKIRGKIKLPALQNQLHIVFGNEALDNQFENSAEIFSQGDTSHYNDKIYIKKQTRQDNASIALQYQFSSNPQN